MEFKPSEELCRQLAEEKDPQEARRLISELRKWVDIEMDEVRLRVQALIKRYHKETENLEDSQLISDSDDSHKRAA